jgi:YD repeat-containing protein
MARMWLVMPAAVALVAAAGCGVKDSGEGTGNGGDPNVAVEASHWGAERVVYASELDWEDAEPFPVGEQSETPPEEEVDYFKCTYYGPKLVKIEGLHGDEESAWMGKWGVRREWKYAAHGEAVEGAWYDEDGRVLSRQTFGYDEAQRLVEKKEYYGGELSWRHAYRYDAEGREVEQTQYDHEGAVRVRVRCTYSGDGKERTQTREEFWEVGEETPRVETVKQRWLPDEKKWEDVLEDVEG